MVTPVQLVTEDIGVQTDGPRHLPLRTGSRASIFEDGLPKSGQISHTGLSHSLNVVSGLPTGSSAAEPLTRCRNIAAGLPQRGRRNDLSAGVFVSLGCAQPGH